MMTLLLFTFKERIRFFVFWFFFLFLLEWFVAAQFAPPQSYSYDYLMGLSYFIMIALLIFCGYRLVNTLYGKTQLFLRSFPLQGWEVFLSHFVLSVFEFFFYITPLYYFISRSLENASILPTNSSFNADFNTLWFSSVGKISLLFMLFLMVIYLFILVLPIFFSQKSTFLYAILVASSPLTCFLLYRAALLSGWESLFYVAFILLIGFFNIIFIRNFFTSYFDRG